MGDCSQWFGQAPVASLSPESPLRARLPSIKNRVHAQIDRQDSSAGQSVAIMLNRHNHKDLL